MRTRSPAKPLVITRRPEPRSRYLALQVDRLDGTDQLTVRQALESIGNVHLYAGALHEGFKELGMFGGTILAGIHTGLVTFIAAGLGARFAFPQMGMEGPAVWIADGAPMRAIDFVVAKWLGSVPVVALFPANGARVDDRGRTQVAARFDERGSGVASVNLRVDGRDVTHRSRVDANEIRYAENLRPGRHVAELVVRDHAGNTTRRSWSFDVVDHDRGRGYGYGRDYGYDRGGYDRGGYGHDDGYGRRW